MTQCAENTKLNHVREMIAVANQAVFGAGSCGWLVPGEVRRAMLSAVEDLS